MTKEPKMLKGLIDLLHEDAIKFNILSRYYEICSEYSNSYNLYLRVPTDGMHVRFLKEIIKFSDFQIKYSNIIFPHLAFFSGEEIESQEKYLEDRIYYVKEARKKAKQLIKKIMKK